MDVVFCEDGVEDCGIEGCEVIYVGLCCEETGGRHV